MTNHALHAPPFWRDCFCYRIHKIKKVSDLQKLKKTDYVIIAVLFLLVLGIVGFMLAYRMDSNAPGDAGTSDGTFRTRNRIPEKEGSLCNRASLFFGIIHK